MLQLARDLRYPGLNANYRGLDPVNLVLKSRNSLFEHRILRAVPPPLLGLSYILNNGLGHGSADFSNSCRDRLIAELFGEMLLDVPATRQARVMTGSNVGDSAAIAHHEGLSGRRQNIEALIPAPETTDVREALPEEPRQIIHFLRARFRAHRPTLRSACPSPRRCRPCGSRSPIRCRTRKATRTKVPSITLVWSRWKIEEWRVVVEVDRDVGLVGVAEDALQRAVRRRP